MAISSLGNCSMHDNIGDPNYRAHRAQAVAPSRSFHTRPVVGIFVGTRWISILLRHGNFSRNFLNMAAAGPTKEISGLPGSSAGSSHAKAGVVFLSS
jgi:hypothetical protein